MKRMISVCLAVLMVLTAWCAQATSEEAPVSFCFPGTEWGESWESIQQRSYADSAAQVKGEDAKQALLTQIEWLGVKVDAAMAFGGADSQTPGLCNVCVKYEEENEQTLLAALEEMYGERQTCFVDKNGVENPLRNPGWIAAQTMEEALLEEEMAFFMELCGGMEQTRVDAILRQPLAVIGVDEENNLIYYQGSTAATVQYIRGSVLEEATD